MLLVQAARPVMHSDVLHLRPGHHDTPFPCLRTALWATLGHQAPSGGSCAPLASLGLEDSTRRCFLWGDNSDTSDSDSIYSCFTATMFSKRLAPSTIMRPCSRTSCSQQKNRGTSLRAPASRPCVCVRTRQCTRSRASQTCVRAWGQRREDISDF